MGRLVSYLSAWAKNARDYHGVNPLMFGILYFGTYPTWGCGVWGAIKNYRADNIPSMLWWMTLVLASFLTPYLYLMIWGKNFSRRFYALLAMYMLLMATTAVIKLIQKI